MIFNKVYIVFWTDAHWIQTCVAVMDNGHVDRENDLTSMKNETY